MATKYTAELYSLALVLLNLANCNSQYEALEEVSTKSLTTFKMVGKKVPSATATISKQRYDTKKTYVEGRDMTLKNAGQSHVASVFRVAPRPKRLTAM
jgi:hypothetical protein